MLKVEEDGMEENKKEVVLSVKNLDVVFNNSRKSNFKAVDNVSFDIYKGETFSLVGESGSGKTTIGRAIVRINPCSSGEILYKGKWVADKMAEGTESQDTLLYEKDGVIDILRNCDKLTFTVGAIFIDDVLEAFAIGSYNKKEKMVVVSIEKGNSEIPGIYQAINQLFLQNSYPDAVLVNREDDMGLEGLRQAKESYNPIGFARKYMVLQKDYQSEKETV